MTRDERDLQAALHELAQRADRDGGPSAEAILAATTTHGVRPGHRTRWIAPLLAAAIVAAAAVVVGLFAGGHKSQPGGQAAGSTSPSVASTDAPSANDSASSNSSAPASTTGAPGTGAAAVLDDAANHLDAAPAFKAPDAKEFYFVRTSEARYWTSVDGRTEGEIRTTDGQKTSVPACVGGQVVASGESGTCTLIGTPHFLGDAPTAPSAWDAFLERIAPGAKASDAQGKITVGVLHDYLVSPHAAAALLRYTATCPGLHTVALAPVDGRNLVGVTCTSMTNGSYGLAFDASTHEFVGFAPLDYQTGKPNSAVELILATGVVAEIGDQP